MKKRISIIMVSVLLMLLFVVQASAATTIKHYSFEIVEENGINIATTTVTSTSAWHFADTISTICGDANYSDKSQYKFVFNIVNEISGDLGNSMKFIGDFTIKSQGVNLLSANPWRTSIWNITDGSIVILDNTILIDMQGDAIPGGSGVVVENGGTLSLINGATVRGFNYNIDEGTRVSQGSTNASIKVLTGGTLNLDSHAKHEPIYCEAGAVVNLSSNANNIQWIINGENFTGSTYTTESAGLVTVDFSIECSNHDYKLTNQKPKNCQNDGINTYTCSICLAQMTETIPSEPDAHVWNEGVCSVCSFECEHIWGEWTLTGPSGYAENQWKDYSGHIRNTCSICQKVEDIEIPELQLGLLEGKSILMSGDSIISGYREDIIASFTGATITKVGVSSATVSTGEGDNRLINQLKKDRENNPNAAYDLLFLFGGINDARCETPIGALSTDGTYDVNTFIGALEELIDYAKKEYPNTKIVYLIPYKTTYAEDTYGGYVDRRDDYTNAMIAVCEKWNIPYLDMYNSRMISGVLNGTVKIETTDVGGGFNNLSNHDGLHLNYSGYYFLSVFVSQMAEKIILGEQQFDIVIEEKLTSCSEEGKWFGYNFTTGDLETKIIEKLPHTKGTITDIRYADGMAKDGAKYYSCTVCLGNEAIEEKAEAIFVLLGYSYKEKGFGITSGFEINKAALREYETLVNGTLELGMIILNPSYATGETFFTNGNLTVNDKAIQVAISSSTKYSTVKCMINNFTDPDLELVIAMYINVITENEGGKVYQTSFVQPTVNAETGVSVVVKSVPKNDATLYTVSYNSVTGNKSK